MRKGMTSGLLAILVLSACDGGGGADQPRNVQKIVVGDNGASIERLRGLSELNRNLALRRAVQDAGQKCDRVESSAEVGTHENLSMWTATCDENRRWAIFIAPTSDIQVRSCGHVAQLGLPTCETGKPAATPKAR